MSEKNLHSKALLLANGYIHVPIHVLTLSEKPKLCSYPSKSKDDFGSATKLGVLHKSKKSISTSFQRKERRMVRTAPSSYPLFRHCRVSLVMTKGDLLYFRGLVTLPMLGETTQVYPPVNQVIGCFLLGKFGSDSIFRSLICLDRFFLSSL